ncbi:hypothetical protein FXF51_22080 [Nonomuraea sp. PA05]|uniref:hypothetical protein n=1 Tax=Nonomuraea sp. PA05 TaxID=2604466 RepID=UPI0011DBE55E|nr:hypothetical protein [Nonomuraea sp. PA05]TYB64401.1 hypothetical protein FXF51_22080 [Nonomuraea sp. PA05]
MNEGTRDEIRSIVEALRGERFDGKREVEREFLDRGAPIVAELLDIAADEGALPHIFKDWFKEVGGAADEFLRIRRDGPGRLRRYALEALASLGAAHRLDPRDRAAVERLVRLRLSDAGDGGSRRPRYWPGFWVTVRGDDLKAITAELGLHHLTRATVPMGVHAAVMEEHFITMTGPAGKPQYAERIFISPPVQGWRILFLGHESLGHLVDWADRLSGVCGEAHAYYNDAYDSDDGFWYVGRDGRRHRGPFSFEDEEDEKADPDTAAAYLSVTPDALMLADDLSDGRLATTHPEVTPWHFRGALPI